jgi:hypothetical protein
MRSVIVIVEYRPEGRQRTRTSRSCAKSRADSAQRKSGDRSRAGHHAPRDGTIIEVSEWKSHDAIDAAHKNSNVLAMWNKFFAICDCVPLRSLEEAEEMFPNFEPL